LRQAWHGVWPRSGGRHSTSSADRCDGRRWYWGGGTHVLGAGGGVEHLAGWQGGCAHVLKLGVRVSSEKPWDASDFRDGQVALCSGVVGPLMGALDMGSTMVGFCWDFVGSSCSQQPLTMQCTFCYQLTQPAGSRCAQQACCPSPISHCNLASSQGGRSSQVAAPPHQPSHPCSVFTSRSPTGYQAAVRRQCAPEACGLYQ
jgi:hypothetical protein